MERLSVKAEQIGSLEPFPAADKTLTVSEDNADRVRALKSQHFGRGRARRPRTGSQLLQELEAKQTEYEMNVAARRETTDKLLAEKDAVIALLRDQITALRQQINETS